MNGKVKVQTAGERGLAIAQATTMAASWLRNRPGLGEEVPPTLYHFTDAGGLWGIVEHHKLWASCATAMNDCSEIQYGIKVAKDLLSQKQREQGEPFLDVALRYLESPGVMPNLDLSLLPVPFIVSLCPDIQRSAHWLHYGRGGKGVAIGFDSGILKNLGATHLVPVEYRPEPQKEHIDSLWGHSRTAFADIVGQVAESVARNFFGWTFSMVMSVLAAEFKAESFSGEKEWRLVSHEMVTTGISPESDSALPTTKFRSSDGRIVAYQEVAFPPDAITEIVLGYSCPMQLDDIMLELFRRRSAPNARLSRSTVPVR